MVRGARPDTAADDTIRQHVAWGPGPRAAQALMLTLTLRSVSRAMLRRTTVPERCLFIGDRQSADRLAEKLAEGGNAELVSRMSLRKARTAIDDVIAAIEGARDKVMADEVKALTKLGIPRAMAYQMVAARFHQNVVTDGEGGGPEVCCNV